MSDEKKTSWGIAPDADAGQDMKKPVPSSAGAAAAHVDSLAAEDDGTEADGRRGRNQHVLPGILGKQLRAAYGELLNTPIPDAIAELIKKLESAQPGEPAARSALDKEGDK